MTLALALALTLTLTLTLILTMTLTLTLTLALALALALTQTLTLTRCWPAHQDVQPDPRMQQHDRNDRIAAVRQHDQRESVPLAVAQLGSCGRSWWPRAARHSQGGPRPLGPQPWPRVLELAASKVALSLRLFI